MGRRGPKKTPTVVLKNRGSWRGKNRDNEPTAPAGRPAIPDFDSPEEIRIWHETLNDLDDLGILSTTDKDGIELYCRSLAGYREMRAIIKKEGHTIEVKEKKKVISVKPRPEVKIANEYFQQCIKLQQSLGLNPSARAELSHVRHSDPNENRGKKKTKSKARFFAAG